MLVSVSIPGTLKLHPIYLSSQGLSYSQPAATVPDLDFSPRNIAAAEKCCIVLSSKACRPWGTAIAPATQHPPKICYMLLKFRCFSSGVGRPVWPLQVSSRLYQSFFPKGAKFEGLQKSKHVLCTNWVFICLLLCLAYKTEKYNYQFTA